MTYRLQVIEPKGKKMEKKKKFRHRRQEYFTLSFLKNEKNASSGP